MVMTELRMTELRTTELRMTELRMTELREAADRRLALGQVEGRLPSVVAGLVRDGELAWSGGAGDVPGDPTDTQYRCGSITKTFVAVLVMQLRDEGSLDLSDPLDVHVPGTAIGRATIAQLLSHSSGLRAETAGPWWERTPGTSFEELRQTNLQADGVRARPGRKFHYSNVGYAILGEVVARLRDASWGEVLETDLLRPLGMTRTSLLPSGTAAQGFAVHPFADVLLPEPGHDHDAMAPAGQLWTTVADLARWAGLLAGRHPTILAPTTIAEMIEPQVVDDRPGVGWSGAHGLGLQVWNDGGHRTHGHGGSMPGFLAGLRVDSTTGDAVVVMANSTAGMSPTLAPDLLALLPPAAVQPWKPTPGADLDLVGTWFWGPSPLLLRATATGLTLTPMGPAGRGSRFVALWATAPSGGSTPTTRTSRYASCGTATAASATSTWRASSSRGRPTT